MRTKTLLAAATAAVILAASGGVAASGAATDYSVQTKAAGVELTVLGQAVLGLATTTATVDASPSATAEGIAASIAGTPVPGTTSAVTLTSGTETDGANCAVPALPAELKLLVSLDAVCSTSSATVAGLPSAKAVAGLGSLSIDATALVDAITALLLDPLNANLATVFEEVENVVNGDVQDALEAACATAAVPLDQVQQVVEDLLGDALAPVTGVLPDNNACAVLLQFVTAAPQLSDVQAAVDALTAALLDAIVDLADIDVSLNATSEVANAANVLTGTSSFGTAALALPSLDLLGTVVALAFDGPVGSFIADIQSIVGGLGTGAPPLPALDELIAEVIDQLGLAPLLADPTPLLSLEVTGSRSSVAVDVTKSTITPTAVAGSITVTLSETLATLLSAPQTTTVGPGQDVVLLEGTPLESRLAVGAATTDATSATGELVTAELLRTFQGGISLKVGNTTAVGASAAPVAAAPAPSPLPATGGGAALLGLAAISMARGLRRRS